MGLGMFLAVLIFMAFTDPKDLSTAGEVVTFGYLWVYGWASIVGVALMLVLHEVGSLLVARHFKVPLRIYYFPFGVNAAAALSRQPRNAWIDAWVGLAGPISGTILSAIAVGIYLCTGNPFFLGMACVGAFYNLFTLIPILDLEGGWVAPAIAPQAWLLGCVAIVLELTCESNLVLIGVICFAVPKLFLLVRARAPREDLILTGRDRLLIAGLYFGLVLLLGWFGTSEFEALKRLVPADMGD